jgi:transmembrane sensor
MDGLTPHFSYYQDCSADELAQDEYFRHWIIYPTPESDEFWQQYLQLNPGKYTEVFKARTKVQAELPLSPVEKATLREAIFEQIRQPPMRYRQGSGLQLVKFAALVAGILLVPVFLLNKQRQTGKDEMVVIRTMDKEIRRILLPDSSVVILNPNSSISYPSSFADISDRTIELAGNAFFEVKKKADSRPFTVHSHMLSIAVTGTEFNVNARSKATEVVLTKGQVKISIGGSNTRQVTMAPGEKIRMDTLDHSLKRSTADTGLYSAWTEGRWRFSSTSLADITHLIHEYYGVPAVYDNEKAKQLLVTAVFPVTDLNSFTNILAKTLDIKITASPNQLLIHL